MTARYASLSCQTGSTVLTQATKFVSDVSLS